MVSRTASLADRVADCGAAEDLGEHLTEAERLQDRHAWAQAIHRGHGIQDQGPNQGNGRSPAVPFRVAVLLIGQLTAAYQVGTSTLPSCGRRAAPVDRAGPEHLPGPGSRRVATAGVLIAPPGDA